MLSDVSVNTIAVLHYLEGMERDSANMTPPRDAPSEAFKSPASHRSGWNLPPSQGARSPKMHDPSPFGSGLASGLQDLAASEVSYGKGNKKEDIHENEDEEEEEDADDVESNVQEQPESVAGTAQPPVRCLSLYSYIEKY